MGLSVLSGAPVWPCPAIKDRGQGSVKHCTQSEETSAGNLASSDENFKHLWGYQMGLLVVPWFPCWVGLVLACWLSNEGDIFL